jgi:hypothetical protein
VGGPSLYIEYIYDANANILAENKEVREWTETQEDVTAGDSDPSIDVPATEISVAGTVAVSAISANVSIDDSTPLNTSVSGDISIDDSTPLSTSVSGNVSIDDSTPLDIAVTGTPAVNSTIQNTSLDTKNQTQYSDSTSNTQYWLGLENDGQLTLQYVDTSVSNQETIFYALPSVSIDGSCLARRYYLSGTDVTGEYTYIGTWTQTMNDRIKPPPTDITVTSGSLTTVEDQVASTVLAGFSVTGGELPVTLSMTSNEGLNVEISGANLVVASGGIDGSASSSSPFTVGIRATDAFGATYDENFNVSVTTNDITDIVLSGTDVANGNVEGTDIGLLTCVGGVGDVNFSITNDGGLDNIKITDTGTSTATLEVDTGGIIDSIGTYTVRITATDSISQTYYEDFTITVLSGFSNTKALGRTSTNSDYCYIDHGQANSAFSGGTGNMYTGDDWTHIYSLPTRNYSISVWFKFIGTPTVDETIPILNSGSIYGTDGDPIGVSMKNGTYGPNTTVDGTYKIKVKAGLGSIWHNLPSGVDLFDEEWHHVVYTWSNANMSNATSTNLYPNSAQHMGGPGGEAASNLKIYIDGQICTFHVNADYNITTSIRFVGYWNTSISGILHSLCVQRTHPSDSYTSTTTDLNYGIGFGNMKNQNSATYLETHHDEFSFHDVELTSTQVGELYNSGAPVALDNAEWTTSGWTTANCLAWFRMFEGDNDSNTTIESMAIGPNGDGTLDLLDWDNTAGSEGFVASSPARTTTPTIKIKNGAGNEVVTLTALADGDVYIP